MGVAVPKVTGPVMAGTSATAAYSVSAGKTAIIGTIILHNTDTSARDVYLYFVTSGQAAGALYEVLKVSLPPGATEKDYWGTNLSAGDQVQVACPAAASVISVRVSAVEG